MVRSECDGPITTVLLDVFGTLIESTPDGNPYGDLMTSMALAPAEVAAAERRLMTTPAATFDAVAGVLREMFPHRTLTEAAVDRARRGHEDAVAGMTLRAGVPDSLIEMADAGLTLVLVSNLSAPYKVPIVRLGIERWVPRRVYSCDVGFRKPDREIFELALSIAGAGASEAVMIGDNPIDDILGARGAGIRAVLADSADPREAGSLSQIASRLLAHGRPGASAL